MPFQGPGEPIHISVPAGSHDPRSPRPSIPGVIVHEVPGGLHPDDVTIVDGLPCTTVERTLIDCAEDATYEELAEMFARADAMGILDTNAMEASFARVEWRPSLYVVRRLMDEYS